MMVGEMIEYNDDELLEYFFSLGKNSFCSKCMNCQHCQNDPVSILSEKCPFRKELQEEARAFISRPENRRAFTCEEYTYLMKAAINVPEAFDGLQNDILEHSLEIMSIPRRSKSSRIFPAV